MKGSFDPPLPPPSHKGVDSHCVRLSGSIASILQMVFLPLPSLEALPWVNRMGLRAGFRCWCVYIDGDAR